MNMHVKAGLRLEHGKSYRGKSGAIHRVETNNNSAWPFKTAEHDLIGSRFWKVDGSAYNDDGWNSRAKTGDALVELAPKFAIGDKVRFTMDNPNGGASYGKKGDVITVASEVSGGGYGAYGEQIAFKRACDGWTFHAPISVLEPYTEPTFTACAAAEVDNLADEYGPFDDGGPYNEPKFNVGDKIRVAFIEPDFCRRTYGLGDVAIIKEYISHGDEHHYALGDDEDSYYTERELDHVAVAPATATATLRIEAGKFYKTRDGRKVGPMEWRYVGTREFPWEGDIPGGYHEGCKTGFIFRLDGTNYEHANLDLIAEWSEPVVAPATTAKFKVGDRVQTPHGTGVVKKTAIVCLLEDGQPLPSARPFVHTSAALAGKEASRLAGIHKGQEFGVYTCTDVKKVDLPVKVYEHEWQRLAAGGEKIKAIKAYRDAGGKRETLVSSEYGYRAGYENRFVIGLKEAKDAVEYWLASAA